MCSTAPSIMLLHVLLAVLVAATAAQTPTTGDPDLATALGRRPHYSMLLDLLTQSGLLTQLNALPQITLFAPTNQALSDIPNDEYNDLKADPNRLSEFLKYHVTTDEAMRTDRNHNDVVLKSLNNDMPIRINFYPNVHTVSVEGVNITERNIRIANGYIQGVEEPIEEPRGDVTDIINDMDDTSILANLLASTGLDKVIAADKNITVFAPTDEAFEHLDDSILTYLQQNPKLAREVLLYHVVQKSTYYSIGMRHELVLKTSDSHKDILMILEREGDDCDDDDDDEECQDGLFVNSARIEERDISATNGVVHTLEEVLIPQSVLVQLEDQGFGHLLVGR